jgi:hypothetical protein
VEPPRVLTGLEGVVRHRDTPPRIRKYTKWSGSSILRPSLLLRIVINFGEEIYGK